MKKRVLFAALALCALMALYTSASAIGVDSVHLYGADSLISGKSAKIEAIVNPQNATGQTLTWTCSDPRAASVSSNGVVTALDVSDHTDVVITATAVGGASGSHEMRISPRAYSIEITPSGTINLDLSTEGYLQFTATITPASAAQDVVWTVSNKKVAHITDGGLLSAKKKGTVTVKAKVSGQESVMASARVVITRLASSVTIKGATTLVSGKKTKLSCEVIPKMGKKAVVWECLTPEFAKISASGKVTAFNVSEPQTAVIKATARNNPEAFDTHEITITPPT